MRKTPGLIAVTAITSLALAGCGTSYNYSAKVVSYQALDPAHLGVVIQVTNNGSTAGSPTCLIQGISDQTGDNGTDDVTLQGTLQPGQTTHFADTFVITSQGAASVNNVTVSCT